MLSERLKEETKVAHVKVEALIIPKIKALDTYQSYKNLLYIFYGFFKPVEEQITVYLQEDVLPDINERRNAMLIQQDLAFIGEQKPDVVCIELPLIKDAATALGAMYVLEGSTLGGIHLSKMIADKMSFTSPKGVAFFSGYRNKTATKWDFFKEQLNNYTESTEVENEVIRSANETFLKFKNWIEKN
jgi:heme oxygenase